MKLSLIGRIQLVETFILLVCAVMYNPDFYMKRINTMLYKFYYKRRTERVTRDILCSEVNQGGLKAPNLQKKIETATAPISPEKPGSVARQPNRCSTTKSRKQFHSINGPSGMPVSMGERPNQRDVSSNVP